MLHLYFPEIVKVTVKPAAPSLSCLTMPAQLVSQRSEVRGQRPAISVPLALQLGTCKDKDLPVGFTSGSA